MDVLSLVLSSVSISLLVLYIVLTERRYTRLMSSLDKLSNAASSLLDFRPRMTSAPNMGASFLAKNLEGKPDRIIRSGDMTIFNKLMDPAIFSKVMQILDNMEREGWAVADKDGVIHPEVLNQAIAKVKDLPEHEEYDEDDDDEEEHV